MAARWLFMNPRKSVLQCEVNNKWAAVLYCGPAVFPNDRQKRGKVLPVSLACSQDSNHHHLFNQQYDVASLEFSSSSSPPWQEKRLAGQFLPEQTSNGQHKQLKESKNPSRLSLFGIFVSALKIEDFRRAARLREKINIQVDTVRPQVCKRACLEAFLKKASYAHGAVSNVSVCFKFWTFQRNVWIRNPPGDDLRHYLEAVDHFLAVSSSSINKVTGQLTKVWSYRCYRFLGQRCWCWSQALRPVTWFESFHKKKWKMEKGQGALASSEHGTRYMGHPNQVLWLQASMLFHSLVFRLTFCFFTRRAVLFPGPACFMML